MSIPDVLAAIIAILFTPIGCWLTYKSIPHESLVEVKKGFSLIRDVASFLLVLCALVVLFLMETLSADPLSRFAVAKMCLYASTSIAWIGIHLLLLLIKSISKQGEIIVKHLNITEKAIEKSLDQ